ncbi:hypothetical protein M2R47_08765 [Moraxella sp. Tifton1]|uniref:hypothetical protein n=1 Tax=Moraxella TaxID=475 RepID=UPI000624DDCC|nr:MULTISPECIES: hypothetical protein [Moraxella]AKG19467.1 hypothetical protein AAX09_08895 [Moraxella bovoculi]MCL1624323.1 hypothetical protein [Moraxella sp. Tifton1]MDH2274435.1 hypothetical protein [Moraxella porci]NSM10515.1 hypothetical protein [Moraxella bovoculi]
MAILKNRENNLEFILKPIKKDNFGFLCDVCLSTSIIKIDYKHTSINDKYISHKNLDYIKREYENLNNIEKFLEETEIIFDIYPIDMFMTLDVYKSNSDTLWVEIKMPTGIFTNGEEIGYFIAFNFWVELDDFKSFILNFIQECEILSI